MSPSVLPVDVPEPASAVEVERLTRELAQVRAEFQDFVHSVSHDLRAPLRHISAFTLIIEEDLAHPPPDIVGHLTTIRQAAQLLTQQLDGLTQLSRISQQPFNRTAVDTAALVRAVVDELIQKYPQRPVQWHIAPDLPVVQADAAMLRQVLVNVLDNALKFTRPVAVAHISVAWQALESGQCRISVQDNGVGFAPQQADKLFRVFGKLHRPRDFEGLGLGLVQARKLMARMGGHISATADVQQGCDVRLQIAIK